MKKNYYSIDKHMGVLNGYYFKVAIGFNYVLLRLYVQHRIGQSTNIQCHLKANVERFRGQDIYTFCEDSRKYKTIIDFIKEFDDIKINKFVNFNVNSDKKISEELLRILG